mmetsp:Transcript_81722/g.243687  ORF Transcript_81722/g.243687 Transcript_81722/m.243687 type:complete len:324 (-) Transcript_81722:599-1570(-)
MHLPRGRGSCSRERPSLLHHGRQGLGAGLAGEPRAELVKEDHATTVPVNLAEVVTSLDLGGVHPAEREALLELRKGDPAVFAVDLVEDPVQFVEVEDVRQHGLELLPLDPVVAVAAGDRLLVRPHQRGLVVQEREALNYELVDLRQGDDAIAIIVQPVPELTEPLLILLQGLDLRLEVVKVLEALLADEVLRSGLVAAVPAQALPTLLTRHDVSVKVGRGIRIHALPDVCAELHKQDLPTVVGVDPVELLHRLLVREVQAQLAHARLEFAGINAAVGPAVHDLEDLPQLVEPKDIQQQFMELTLLDPVVSITVLQDGLLVGTH